MQKSKRRAGQTIRGLAMKRRSKAMVCFASAVGLVVLPFIVQQVVSNLLSQFTSFSNAQSPASFTLPLILYLLCAIASLGLVIRGRYWWRRANHADQGARGEEEVAKTLSELISAGWQIEYNVSLGKGLGDADILCISPRHKSYVIDVKSHRGTVVTDGDRLYRRLGQQQYPFEKDFLKQVVKQALQLKKQRDFKFVTPIIAFSEAKVNLKAGKLQNVYVVEKSRLPYLLKKLG